MKRPFHGQDFLFSMSRHVQGHASMDSGNVRNDVNRLGTPLLSLPVGIHARMEPEHDMGQEEDQ
jgi:hypothetical protein